MIAISGEYECKPLMDDKSEVISFLNNNIYLNDDNLKDVSMSQLKKLVYYAKVLVCYKGSDIIGVAVYRYVSNYIDLLHMYVAKDYRCTRGSGLINHYLINVLGKGCEIKLKSGDITTFKDVIIPQSQSRKYTISDRARQGLKRYMKGHIVWKEQE